MKYFDEIWTLNFKVNCDWVPANHFLFQFANLFLVLIYFVKPNNLSGLKQLRFALCMAGFCFGLWGGTIICSLDCMLWNLVFAFGNLAHLVYLMIQTRPVKFSADLELIYSEIFRPVGVKRIECKSFMQLAREQHITAGSYYAKYGVSETSHIGIILSGRFEVLLQGKVISHIDEMELINSPEWIASNQNDLTTYQVSLVAATDTLLYEWDRKDLLKLFKQDGVMKNVFDSLIGRDICKKLFAVHRKMLTNDSDKVSNLLHQIPIFTYSTANVIEHHKLSCENIFRKDSDINNQTSFEDIPMLQNDVTISLIDVLRQNETKLGNENEESHLMQENSF